MNTNFIILLHTILPNITFRVNSDLQAYSWWWEILSFNEYPLKSKRIKTLTMLEVSVCSAWNFNCSMNGMLPASCDIFTIYKTSICNMFQYPVFYYTDINTKVSDLTHFHITYKQSFVYNPKYTSRSKIYHSATRRERLATSCCLFS